MPPECAKLSAMSKNPLSFFTGFLENLRSPQLVMLLGLLFLIDLFVPDPLPFIDEAVLFLLTMLAARWKQRPQPEPAPKPPTKNVTPASGS